MNECYYSKYLKVKQIIKNDKVVGDLRLIKKAYGFIVELKYFDTPGYKHHETFPDIVKACNCFNKLYEKEGKQE